MNKQMTVGTKNVKTIMDLLTVHKKQIEMALPRHMDADRLARIAMTCIRQNPKLMACNPLSLFAAVIQSAQLGLEPGLMGQAYLIPYGTECQFQVGYKGMVKLARNSGQIQSFSAEVVHEKDEFVFEQGLDDKLKHKPSLEEDPGPVTAAYAVVKFKDGGHQFVVLSVHQIKKIRDDKSESYRKFKSGPWVSDPEEMYKKTVAKRLCKWLDLSPELNQAIAIDNQADTGTSQQLDLQVFGDTVDVMSDSAEAKRAALKMKLEAKNEKAHEQILDKFGQSGMPITTGPLDVEWSEEEPNGEPEKRQD